MFKFLRAGIRLIVCTLISVFYLIIILLSYITGTNLKFRFMLAKQWAKLINKTLGIVIAINNKDIPKGVLVLPNHRSWMDIPLIFSIIPATIISKKEISYWPIIGWGFFAIDAILVDRSKMSSLIETFREIKNKILAGKTVILFPEGTICEGPLTGRFKNGAFKVAADHQIEIVPVAFEFKNRKNVWATDEVFLSHYFKTMGKKWTYIKVEIGDPFKSDNADWLSNTTKNWMDEKIMAMRMEWDKNESVKLQYKKAL
jgi:1-acyl-sn-glycerol-3-phosphate acyltransferase